MHWKITINEVDKMPPKDDQIVCCYGLGEFDEFFDWHKAQYDKDRKCFWRDRSTEKILDVKFWFALPRDPREDDE